jgi:Rieske Fe-S protein
VGIFTFFHPLRGKKETPGAGVASGFVRVAPLASVPRDLPQKFAVKSDLVDAWTRSPNEPVGAVYLQRKEGDTVACFNAICPHAGCFVNCSGGAKAQFSCPCHESFFDLDGKRGDGSPSPRDLDSLNARIVDVDGAKFVEVQFENYYTGRPDKKQK